LLVAARHRLANRRLNALQVGDQFFVGLVETAHGKAEGLAQAGHVHRAGRQLRGHIAQLAGLSSHMGMELLAGLGQRGLAGADQCVDHAALFGRGVVDRVQQGAERAQDAGALFEQGVVARHADRDFLAQLANHFGCGFGRFGGRLDQAGDRVFQCCAQRGQVLRHGGL